MTIMKASQVRRLVSVCACVLLALSLVVPRLLWKGEMAHSSGELDHNQRAACQDRSRRNAPGERMPRSGARRVTDGPPRWES